MISLYQLNKDFENALSAVDSETGELPANFENICKQLVEKRETYCHFILNRESQIVSAKAQVKAYLDKIKKEEERIEKMRQVLKENMQAHNITEIKANDLSFTAKIKTNPPSVVIDDNADIPNQFLLPPKPREPDKKAIKEALLNPQSTGLSWARIVQKERLVIE